MPRNNSRRTGSTSKKETEAVSSAPVASVLDFVTPTDVVDLPSGGRFYDEDHPLHNKETIEIRYMTARDEDTLTNQSYLKKGVALEKLMQNLIIDKRIHPGTLLVGDRGAILMAARISAYGSNYKTSISCPSCGETSEFAFDLSELQTGVSPEDDDNEVDVTHTDDNTYTVKLPLTGVSAEFRLLTGNDELAIAQAIQKARNRNKVDGTLSTQFSRAIVSLNSETDREVIRKFALLMPASDARVLRRAIQSVTPALDMNQNFECPECGHEQEMEVPLTADFFWPDR